MRQTIIKLIVVLIVLFSRIWILQGVNRLPGSIMTANPHWTINGAVAAVIGTGLFWSTNRT